MVSNDDNSSQKNRVMDNPETSRAMFKQNSTRYEGPLAPVIASIVAIIVWAVFILVYALFWSTSFTLFQNVIVTIVSLLITGLLIGLMWVLLTPRGSWRGR